MYQTVFILGYGCLFTNVDQEASSDKKVVWIDLGGGTGWNIEQMNKILPVSCFHAIYLIDITPSLCEVAKERFQNLGWKNVHVVCQDALEYSLPDFCEDVEVGLVTLSYSRNISLRSSIIYLYSKHDASTFSYCGPCLWMDR
jgi:betaine lipid synthase